MKASVLLITGLAAIGLMASCASNDEVTQTEGGTAKFIISLTGSSSTKSATTKSEADTSSSATINRVAVGLFDASGNVVSITEPTLTGGTVTVTGTTLVTQVAVVANAPSGAFASVKTLTAFHAIAIDISNTTSSDGSSTTGTQQYASNLPMEGDTSGIDASSGSVDVSVSLTRLVSKIELDKITVSFDAAGAYAGYVFVPTEIFMSNVAETAYADESSPYVTGPTYLIGWIDTTATKSYLTTDSINKSLTAATAETSYATTYAFYPMANDGSLSGNSKTKLIIKGTIYTSSTATSGTTYYYPIIINHAMAGTTDSSGDTYTANGTDGEIAPNSYYKLTATIKGLGVTSPTDELSSASIYLTVSVVAWDDEITQNVTFN